MGLARGCCKFAAAFGVVPASVLVAVLLETPLVVELDSTSQGETHDSGSAASAAAADSSGGAKSSGEFGTAISGGMGSGSMFDRIAFAYDSTNKWMSLGLDQRWRRALIDDCMRLEPNDRVLDLATGTADVSILAGTKLQQLGGATGSEGPVVLGLDPSSEMLRRGVSKVEGRGLNGVVRLVKGDAQDLSSVRDIDAAGAVSEPMTGVPTESIDKISMSFGVRNVPDRSLALREMRRVLRNRETSRVCILEFSLPDGKTFWSGVARTFITKVVPFIGKVATMGSGGEEYQYLERSILKFPMPRDFAAEMGSAGLSVRTITSFAYGAVNLYSASPRI